MVKPYSSALQPQSWSWLCCAIPWFKLKNQQPSTACHDLTWTLYHRKSWKSLRWIWEGSEITLKVKTFEGQKFECESWGQTKHTREGVEKQGWRSKNRQEIRAQHRKLLSHSKISKINFLRATPLDSSSRITNGAAFAQVISWRTAVQHQLFNDANWFRGHGLPLARHSRSKEKICHKSMHAAQTSYLCPLSVLPSMHIVCFPFSTTQPLDIEHRKSTMNMRNMETQPLEVMVVIDRHEYMRWCQERTGNINTKGIPGEKWWEMVKNFTSFDKRTGDPRWKIVKMASLWSVTASWLDDGMCSPCVTMIITMDITNASHQ